MQSPGQEPTRDREEILYEDRFVSVEQGIGFRKLTCYRCGYVGLYRYRVSQIRRRPEIHVEEGDEIRPDHVEIWKTVPRFAEVPETVKCKRCREVLGVYGFCIF
ncbi:MAG: hypothetical protein HY645_15555 [Acidobacteria bacterium]|nr:hypothetical protein [Acidobacteriota bacterium]